MWFQKMTHVNASKAILRLNEITQRVCYVRFNILARPGKVLYRTYKKFWSQTDHAVVHGGKGSQPIRFKNQKELFNIYIQYTYMYIL